MNKFLEEKEKLLNGIENNTPNHWKEYYKNVPLDCIFDDLVLDVNEIKRLTKENQQLKEKLNCDLHWAFKYDELHQENQQLKEQYCERTDCSGRIGNSKRVEELEKENKQLKENNLAMQEEMARTWAKLQQKEDTINKAKEELYIWGEALFPEFQKKMLKILDNKGE